MNRLALAVVVVAILLVGIGWAATAHFPDGSASSTSTAADSATSTVTTASSLVTSASVVATKIFVGNSSGNWLPDSPAFAGDSSKIDYPPDYGAIANFTLGVIDMERASAGMQPVTLSSVPSGQQHADSMAYYGYFSHWDNQGYKPYMRYTLLGGTGSVEENLALDHCTTSQPNATLQVPAPCSIQTVEDAINSSEWMMLNNDSACCGNGHQQNILNPLHNRVSLGVAYNSTMVFLVEDFENGYLGNESLQLSGGTVNLQGMVLAYQRGWMESQSGAEISVYFDPTPTNISLDALRLMLSCSQYSELNESLACQYQGAYTPGALVSTVFYPCPAGRVCSTSGNYTYAQQWQTSFTTGDFDIVFSISALETTLGSGVYTFYLWPAEAAAGPITSLSVFVSAG
jgi:uncharacterized protein YkwD